MAIPYRWWFFAMLFVGIYSSIHNVLQPYVLKILLDAVAHAEKNQFLDVSLKPALLLIILGFVITFIWRLYNYIVLRSLPKIKADIIAATTAYLRDQSYVFFQDHLSGSISAKISDLTSNIQNIVNTWFNISRQGLTIILSIAMVGLVSPYFSLIFSLSQSHLLLRHIIVHTVLNLMLRPMLKLGQKMWEILLIVFLTC